VSEGRRDLSPEQRNKLDRLQAMGVLSLVGVGAAMSIAAHFDVFDSSKVLAIGFAAAIAIVFLITVAVSRIEARPLSDVVRFTFQEIVDDLKAAPVRLVRAVRQLVRRNRSN
jgi:hypothetical protein